MWEGASVKEGQMRLPRGKLSCSCLFPSIPSGEATGGRLLITEHLAMPSIPSTLATPIFIWTESNCYAMLFLMDQNVFRKETFEILPKLIFCLQKNSFLKALNLDMSSFKLQL